MISDLYYASLGLRDPDQYRRFVMARMDDYRQYLDNAVRRLRKQTYEFDFKSLWCILKENEKRGDDRPDPFSIDLFLDETGKQKARVNKEKREIHLSANDPRRVVYGFSNKTLISYEFSEAGYIIEDIKPMGVSEEAEDEAMDVLYNSWGVYGSQIDLREKQNKIEFHLLDRRSRRAIISALPPSGRLWATYITYVLEMQRKAIEILSLRPRPHHLPLLDLMQREQYTEWGIVRMDAPSDSEFMVLTDTSRSGSIQQREFVRKALGTPDFCILEGPPGSGKTTTLLEIIAQEIKSGHRVLMVASTHVAVDNILERLMKERIIDGKKQRLIDACGIIPLRIGDEGNVSDQARKFCIHNSVDTELKRLIGGLEDIKRSKSLSKAQENLYRDLIGNDGNGRDIIEQLLFECANFVCGTTIGVLQAPMIKGSKEAEPLFDMVILDEASKTTFHEFLVPALYGKKWVLSGDVRQLAPYVDVYPIAQNIKAIPAMKFEIDRRVIMAAFKASRWSDQKTRMGPLVIEDEGDISEFCGRLESQISGLETIDADHGIAYTSLTSTPKDDLEKLRLYGSNLVVLSRSLLPEVQDILPPCLESEESVSPIYERRQRAYKGLFEREGQMWEEAVQWRICRMHEVAPDSATHKRYEDEIKALLPYYESGDNKKHGNRSRTQVVDDEIKRIQSIALPSVLLLLQNGYEGTRMPGDPQNIALYSGLSYNGERKDVLQARHTLLTYQHRMHSDISDFPRREIYLGTALNDADGIDEQLEWPSKSPFNYEKRTVWINANPKKSDLNRYSRYNLAEVRTIMDQLKVFMRWSKNHNKTGDEAGEKWKVAIISFYKGQVNKIIEELRNIDGEFGLKGRYSDFTSNEYNVEIKVATVDRFQGNEADLVLLSFVRSKGKGIGFLDNANRLNVAITRARYQLIMVGDREHFMRAKNAETLKKLAEQSPTGDISYRGGNN